MSPDFCWFNCHGIHISSHKMGNQQKLRAPGIRYHRLKSFADSQKKAFMESLFMVSNFAVLLKLLWIYSILQLSHNSPQMASFDAMSRRKVKCNVH